MSPLRLVQERLPRGPLYPWRMFVACALLNRTRGQVGVPAAMDVLRRWPEPRALMEAPPFELRRAIRACGFVNKRERFLRLLSQRWWLGAREPDEFRGTCVGKYATDSYRIFCRGEHPRGVTDGKLRPYLAWARKNDVRADRTKGRGR